MEIHSRSRLKSIALHVIDFRLNLRLEKSSYLLQILSDSNNVCLLLKEIDSRIQLNAFNRNLFVRSEDVNV